MGKFYDCAFIRMPVCLLVVIAFAGCGAGNKERAVSELHFEIQPLTSPERGIAMSIFSGRSEWVHQYFTSEELHAELGELLGRTVEDVGASLTVAASEDSEFRYVLRAKGEDSEKAAVLASEALFRFEDHLIESQRRISEESIAHLEKQIELQKLKVAAAKAEMDAAYEKLKEVDTEGELE